MRTSSSFRRPPGFAGEYLLSLVTRWLTWATRRWGQWGAVSSPSDSACRWILVKDLTTTANTERGLRGEKDQLGTEVVGHALNRIGLAYGGRTNAGARRWLDESARRQIHLNVKSFGVDSLGLDYGPQLANCPLCQEYGLENLVGKPPIGRGSASKVSADLTHETSADGTVKWNKE